MCERYLGFKEWKGSQYGWETAVREGSWVRLQELALDFTLNTMESNGVVSKCACVYVCMCVHMCMCTYSYVYVCVCDICGGP